MKNILAIILLSFSLNTFAEERAAEASTQQPHSISFSQYVELFAGLVSIAMGNPMPKPVKTESEYRAEINQGAKVILYNIKTDLMIKNWGKE